MSWVRRLNVDYGDFRLEIPEWEILDDGVTALWGPSGAGKTSVFRVLIGLDPCPGFSWDFKGEDLARLPVPRRRLGVVFQTLELFPHMTAAENILFGAEARSIPKKEAREHLEELARLLGLGSVLERKSALLSGGERQRVALARALIGKPRFLFLDEPFSALDAGLRHEARVLVQRVIEAERIPALLITHDREDLDVLAKKITEIRDGRLVSGL
ncbi:MAG: ATP-binding cassette domain-containing protein [Bdellovibrionaceae bacterium]|nr:ATP-binding cassette domain-containing protein [Pseudobdellovibrionaceae bacterium]